MVKFGTTAGQTDFGQMYPSPSIVEVSDQVDISVRSLGQADLWSDIPLHN